MSPSDPTDRRTPPAGRPPWPAADDSAPRQPSQSGPAEVETFQIVRWLSGESTGSQHVPELVAGTEEPFRPVLRPPIPVLTVLDDGSLEEGEQIRIRTESFSIGRTAGDFVVPLDATMSGRHAEIRLCTDAGKREWRLHNLESVNGTFVRVGGASLGNDSIVILGSRRYRLERPKPPAPRDRNRDETLKVQEHVDVADQWPILVEAANKPSALRFPLRSSHVTIGRKGGGCGIQIDDPQIAPVHAEIFLDPAGVWKLSLIHI